MEGDAPPVLVHVGYHKTATTWLQRVYFPEHPGVHMPFSRTRLSRVVARPHPFVFDAARARDTLMEGICSAPPGTVAALSNERLAGNPVSGGVDAFEMVDRLQATLPEARIWIALREQTAAIASFYKQSVKQGATSSLATFLEGDRPHKRIPYFTPDHFHYLPLVRRFEETFGPDRVIVTLFEEFSEDRDAVLDRIGDFAGFTHDRSVGKGAGRQNVSLSDRSARILRILNGIMVHPDAHDHFRPLVRLPGQYYTRRLLKATDRIRRGGRTLRPKVARILGDRFADSNRRLGRHLGMDLSRWGYVTEGR